MTYTSSSTIKTGVAHTVIATTSDAQVAPACRTEPDATILWESDSRKVYVKDGGCADMTRILSYLTNTEIPDVLSEVRKFRSGGYIREEEEERIENVADSRQTLLTTYLTKPKKEECARFPAFRCDSRWPIGRSPKKLSQGPSSAVLVYSGTG